MSNVGHLTGAALIAVLMAPPSVAQSLKPSATAAPSTAPAARVAKAHRAERYTSPRITPDTPGDIVLVLSVGGFGSEDWERIPGKEIYVMAGDRRCSVILKGLGQSRSNSDGSVVSTMLADLVLLAPRAVRKMTLHLPGYPAVEFTADETVKPELPGLD